MVLLHVKAEELLAIVERLPAGARTQFLTAQALPCTSRCATRRPEEAERRFKGAAAFPLGVTRLEHAEWLTAQGRPEEAEPLFGEARELFERLHAKRWFERLPLGNVEEDAGARVASA
jgi:hypothetical protein